MNFYNLTTKLKSNLTIEEKKELIKKYVEEKHKDINKTNYLKEQRHITNEQLIEYFKIGYDKELNYLILPYSNKLNNLTVRQINNCFRFSKLPTIDIENRENLFNFDSIKDSEICFITESVLDSLSILEILLIKDKDNKFLNGYVEIKNIKITSIALNGIGNYKEFLTRIKIENLQDKIFISSLDNDPQGKTTATELKKELDKLNIKNTIAGWNDRPQSNEDNTPRKDCNDHLKNNKNLFYLDVLENIESIATENDQKQENFINDKSDFLKFEEDQKQLKTTATPTTYEKLDKYLNGGLYESKLYILGAMSGLGKTTFLLNLMIQLARQEKDVLYFSLEMSRQSLRNKILSNLSYFESIENLKTDDYAKTENGIRNYTENEENKTEFKIIKTVKEDYKNNLAKHIFFYIPERKPTTDFILTELKEYLKIMRKKPFIFIDYLQLLNSQTQTRTDKEKTDSVMEELANIKNEYGVCVFCLSSLNRNSYNSAISLDSFKESGAIEYSSDVLLGLQPRLENDLNEERIKSHYKSFRNSREKEDSTKKMELIILKNRDGATNIINFSYNKFFNVFKEIEND